MGWGWVGEGVCAVWAETKTVTQHERVRLDYILHKPKENIRAGWKL